MPGSYHITLAGIISDEAFHKCLTCVRDLEKNFPGHVQCEVLQFFPAQWDQYLKRLQNDLKGNFYQHKGSPIVFVNNSVYIGGEESFIEWALQEYRYTDKTSVLIYRKQAADALRNAINNTPGRSYVYMNINTGAAANSKVVIELFDDICPKTCENFRQLCQGFQKTDKSGAKQPEILGYAGSEFHRVVKGMYIQGGDLSKVFTKYKDGFSVYDGEFADESFQVKHTEPGLLGMCKRSSVQHTNECQFYVTLGAPLSFMDGQTVIFGRVIEGFRVFKLIEKMDTTNERPHPPVQIENAGIHKLDKPQLKSKVQKA